MPRRIIFFHESGAFGGDDAVLLESARAWPAGDELAVALNAGHPGAATYAAALAGRARLLSVPELTATEERAAGLAAWSRPLRWLAAVARLRRLFAAEKPDAVLLVSGGWPLDALSFRALCAARLCGLRPLVCVHGFPGESSGARALYLALAGRAAALLCGRLATVSSALARVLERATGREVAVVPNGLAPRVETMDAAAKRRRLGAGPGPLVGAIGNLVPWKGYTDLLRAMEAVAAEFPDARLAVIGPDVDPAEAAAVRRLAEGPALKGRVLLPGFLPDAGQYAECFDVCAVPSRSESFGLAALEAMRYGKPVVAARVGGLPELVEDGANGVLVSAGDPPALARAIADLLRRPGEAKRLGEEGRRSWQKRFTADTMAKSYEALA